MLEAEVIDALQHIGVEPYVNHLFFSLGALHIMSIHDTYDMIMAFTCGRRWPLPAGLVRADDQPRRSEPACQAISAVASPPAFVTAPPSAANPAPVESGMVGLPTLDSQFR